MHEIAEYIISPLKWWLVHAVHLRYVCQVQQCILWHNERRCSHISGIRQRQRRARLKWGYCRWYCTWCSLDPSLHWNSVVSRPSCRTAWDFAAGEWFQPAPKFRSLTTSSCCSPLSRDYARPRPYHRGLRSPPLWSRRKTLRSARFPVVLALFKDHNLFRPNSNNRNENVIN